MATKKKILMIIPNLGFGGAQRVFHDLAVCLRADYEVIECVFNFENGHAYPSENKIVSLDVPGGRSVVSKMYFFALRIVRLKRLKRSLGIHSAISHLEGADYVNILSAAGEEIVLCIHGSKRYDQKIAGWLGWIRMNILLKLLYRRADKIVVVANGIKEELLQNFGVPAAKVTVINNGFDLAAIQAKAKVLVDHKLDPVLGSKAILITHGRLAEEKNQATLINVMQDARIRKNFRLVLIGDGPLRDKLINHARQLGLNTYSVWEGGLFKVENEVIFLGYDPNPFAVLSKASLYLFPSLFEGFPLALGEAMACGLPVIARNCHYGPRDILNPEETPIGEQGYLFATYGTLISNDIHDEDIKKEIWVRVITVFLENPSLLERYRIKVLERSVTMSQDVFRDKWLKVLQLTNEVAHTNN